MKHWLSFLRWFCPPHLYEAIEGDVLERYDADVESVGEKRARRRLAWNVIKFFRPGIVLRNRTIFNFYFITQAVDMFKSYIRTAFRSMHRHKIISFINIFGLAMCLAVGLLVIILIKTKFSYDRFNPDLDRMVRITEERSYVNGIQHLPTTPPFMADELKSYSVVEDAVSLIGEPVVLKLNMDEVPVDAEFTTSSFFTFFDFELTSGEAASALDRPFTTVISQNLATRLFGKASPIGKPLDIKGLGEFTVTGVIRDRQERSRVLHDMLLSRSSLPSLITQGVYSMNLDGWSPGVNTSSFCFVRLKQGIQKHELDLALGPIAQRGLSILRKDGQLKDIRFHALGMNEMEPSNLVYYTNFAIKPGMNFVEILGFSLFAFLFILLAVFNYTNLTVSRALGRSKEVGIRRVSGARPYQIVFQIFTEAILIALFALVLAFVMVRFIPLDPTLARNIDFGVIDGQLIVYALLFAIGTGLLAGFFPGLVLSRINPIQALSKLLNTRLFKSMKVRNVLVVTQFSLSIIFMVLIYVLHSQYSFLKRFDRGFDTHNKITIELKEANYRLLQTELERNADVDLVSASSDSPAGGRMESVKNSEGTPVPVNLIFSDQNFSSMWGLTLLAGTDFPETPQDGIEHDVLINESAAKKFLLGSPEQAIGKFIEMDSLSLKVIGVLKDFHHGSLKWGIESLLVRDNPTKFKELQVRYHAKNEKAVNATIQKVWHTLEPDFPLVSYNYYDNLMEQQDKTVMMKMFDTLLVIAILVSCLGLLGIVLYGLEVRTKEIAIRKMMGSSVSQLVLQLSMRFFKLLIIASCIALPAGYLGGMATLQEFAVKVDFGPGMLLMVLTFMFLVGVGIIGSQALRAALANPVNALKDE